MDLIATLYLKAIFNGFEWKLLAYYTIGWGTQFPCAPIGDLDIRVGTNRSRLQIELDREIDHSFAIHAAYQGDGSEFYAQARWVQKPDELAPGLGRHARTMEVSLHSLTTHEIDPNEIDPDKGGKIWCSVQMPLACVEHTDCQTNLELGITCLKNRRENRGQA